MADATNFVHIQEAAFWSGLFVLDRGLAEVLPAKIARGWIHVAIGAMAFLYGVGWLSEATWRSVVVVVIALLLGIVVLKFYTKASVTPVVESPTDDWAAWIVKRSLLGIVTFLFIWLIVIAHARMRSLGYDLSNLFQPNGSPWKYVALGASIACVIAALAFIIDGPARRSTGSEWKPRLRDAPMASFRGSMVVLKNFPPGNSKDLPQVEFWTNNNNSRLVTINGRPRQLRFLKPTEQLICDVPAIIPCEHRWFRKRGRLVIKQFTDTGFALQEENTSGEQVIVEIYYDNVPVSGKSNSN